MKIGSLFSGTGQLDIAVQTVFGGDIIWHSETDRAATKVLKHHWPAVTNLSDITRIDWDTIKPVDIICGGFPCTDVSTAGLGKGLHGTRSGLWSHMADAINTIKPSIVIIENVRGLLSANSNRPMEQRRNDLGDTAIRPVLRAAGAVFGDLADAGYDAQWVTVAASKIGTPHRRERVFILATPTLDAGQLKAQGKAAATGKPPAVGPASSHLLPTPCAHDGKGTGPSEIDRATPTLQCIDKLLPTPEAKNAHANQDFARADRPQSGGDDLVTAVIKQTLLPTPIASDGNDNGAPPSDKEDVLSPALRKQLQTEYAAAQPNWGKYAAAIQRWEQLTRPAPPPTEPNSKGNPRLHAPFAEWMMGWPAGWVTQVPGTTRNEQLRMIGNGVCPQQAIHALHLLVTIHERTTST